MKFTFILVGLLSGSILFAQNFDFEQLIPPSPFPQNIAEISGTDSGDSNAADLDNDGDIDFIITGYGNFDLTTKIYLNDGIGNFLEDYESTLTPMYNSSVELADLNGDGSPDIILSGRPDNMFGGTETLTEIYLNDGNGTFTIIPHSIPDLSYGDIDSGDLDNDGDIDIVICGEETSGFAFAGVYLNNGSAEFTLNQQLTGSVYGTILLGDTDNDGDLDLYLSGNLVTGISVNAMCRLHENDGEGFFTTMPLGLSPSMNGAAVFFDMDSDGDLDLLVNGRVANSLVRTDLYLNNGNNLFELVENTPFQDSELGDIGVSDFDLDGDLDVLMTGIQGVVSHTRLYTNDGTGDFVENTDHEFDDFGMGSVLFADFNSDSYEDVLIGGDWSEFTNINRVFLNNGTGHFSPILNTPFEDISGDFNFADVDNDGDLDFIQTGGHTSSRFQTNLYINEGSMIFSKSESEFYGVRNSSVKFSDIDLDGDMDVIISGEIDGYEPLTVRYTNDGNGNFSEVGFTNVTDLDQAALLFFDIDNDGDEDLIAAGENSNGEEFIRLFENNDASLLANINTPFIPLSNPTLNILDVNGDGIKEVISFGNDGINPAALVYSLDGSGGFELFSSSLFDPVNYPRVIIGDIDIDGDDDLLLSGSVGFGMNTEYVLYYYQNLNDGSFNRIDLFEGDGLSRGALNLSDFDLDGDLDLIVSGYNLSGVEETKVYENIGEGEFNEVFEMPFHHIGWSHMKSADLDNDGDLDLMYCGIDRNNNEIFRLFENKVICVGLNQYNVDNHTEDVIIFPNPSSLSIKINSKSRIPLSSVIQIVNMDGEIIMEEEFQKNKNYDISKISSGVYFVSIFSENRDLLYKTEVLMKR